MALEIGSRHATGSASPERDHRAFGWWGLALVACGVLALIFAAGAFALE